eukprot:m.110180 g.110180  ORF g.110180 m.110180 type:complete len:67 (+) comp12877_c3_seq1:976-1176(+)
MPGWDCTAKFRTLWVLPARGRITRAQCEPKLDLRFLRWSFSARRIGSRETCCYALDASNDALEDKI